MTRYLGILGGGQLGRMLALAARPLGIEVTVVDPSRDAPASAVAHHIVAEYDDPDALSLLARSDCVTFEFENVPDAAARQLARARPVFPSPESLRIAQDRKYEKEAFARLGIGTAEFRIIDNLADAHSAFDQLGPLVMKTRRFGYDGKGQARARRLDEVEEAYATLQGAPAIAEALVDFSRELSIIVCRGRDGQCVYYPLVQNQHANGVLRRSDAPAPDVDDQLDETARRYARSLVEEFDYVGVLALELFQLADGTLLANEFAPRVHNSGHWTIEGAQTSQFENHVRAVCGLPLGSTEVVRPTVMLNLLGRVPEAELFLELPDTHLHDYAKKPRRGRKVGHVTIRADQAEGASELAAHVERLLVEHADP